MIDSDSVAYKQLSKSVIDSIVKLNLPQDLEQFVKQFNNQKATLSHLYLNPSRY